MTNDRLDTISITRRRTLRALTLIAAGGAAACRKSDPDSALSIEALHNVSKVHGSRLTDKRLEELRPSIEQQLARLEAVRGFDLDESVAPATVFLVKHAPESSHANLRRTLG